jgi:hypothetical protein
MLVLQVHCRFELDWIFLYLKKLKSLLLFKFTKFIMENGLTISMANCKLALVLSVNATQQSPLNLFHIQLSGALLI